MDWQRTCVAVIPCCNEAATIRSLTRAIARHLPKVLVVNDGSTDDTAAEASTAGAAVVTLPKNRGKGAALRVGLSSAYRAGFAWALLMDGDAQHDPEDIPALLKAAEETNTALVVGNRMHDAANMPWLRRRVNQLMSWLISLRAGQTLLDTQSGFRLVKLAAWAELNLVTEHFEVESELLLAMVKQGYSVRFVPVRTIGRGQGSHIDPVVDTWRWLRWWLRAPGSSLVPTAAPAVRKLAGP